MESDTERYVLYLVAKYRRWAERPTESGGDVIPERRPPY